MPELIASLLTGMPVELMVGPDDIRSTSVVLQKDNRITLRQTTPSLKTEWMDQSIPMTFIDPANSSRAGYKIKVLSVGCDPGDTHPSYIEAELQNFIERYDLRKYPRFNPKLFEPLCISYHDGVVELHDVSSGGARGIYHSKNSKVPARGEFITLAVKIGKLRYFVKAEVVRIRLTGTESADYEIAVAFEEWDNNFLDATAF